MMCQMTQKDFDMPRKKKKVEAKAQMKRPPSMEVHEEAELQAEHGSQSVEAVVNQSFFYTNDKFFDQLDNNDIMKAILKKYPRLSTSNTDSIIKKALIEMLNDEAFVSEILSYYNISIYDLFKMLHKTYSSIFKGTYLKKVKSNLEGKSYVSKKRR